MINQKDWIEAIVELQQLHNGMQSKANISVKSCEKVVQTRKWVTGPLGSYSRVIYKLAIS